MVTLLFALDALVVLSNPLLRSSIMALCRGAFVSNTRKYEKVRGGTISQKNCLRSDIKKY
jgi:hypothetical protein